MSPVTSYPVDVVRFSTGEFVLYVGVVLAKRTLNFLYSSRISYSLYIKYELLSFM
jgi:hypothetical protein